MGPKIIKYQAVAALLLSALLLSMSCSNQAAPRIKALIVSGQNNHNWQVSHKVLELILETSALFEADIALTAPVGGDMSTFRPDSERR